MSNLNDLNQSGKKKGLPKIRCIHQEIKTPSIKNLKTAIRDKLKDFGLKGYINPNEKVAITASSRGISNQDIILKAIVKFITDLKALPFIIPAMGSHGSGTMEGQLQILKDYGITEESMGCPIKAGCEVVELGLNEFGYPVYFDKYAASADKIIVFNKIKTHSKFLGEVESGLSKMCLIGLGNDKGAKLYHRLIARHSWTRVLKSNLKIILQKTPIICGIAIIQNINNEPTELHILHPNDFSTKEPKLLERYKELTENLPFKEIDLLIVDEMGKNIFGTGMDTNITGRKEGSKIHVQWLFVRDLTAETHGNAQGIGLADFTTKRLVDKINYSATYFNALTAYRTDSPKIPIFLPTDKDVLNTILDLAGLEKSSSLRLVWIKNTLELKKIIVSESYFDQVDSKPDLDFVGDSEMIQFDEEGFLVNSKKYWGKE